MKAIAIYTTFDGHKMEEGEIMWRVCNNDGEWDGGEPAQVTYMIVNGYNYPDASKSLYPKNQIHFFDKEKADAYLKRFRSFPTIEELNHFISFYRPDYCPCQLGKPFYPYDNCECGG